MSERGNRVDWGIFLLLGLVWGSSYLFIKLAVDDFGTFTLVALRLAHRGRLPVGRRPAGSPGAAARTDACTATCS